MPPETDVADVNANSSTEDVVKAAEAASEAKASEESTGDEQDAEGLEGKPEEGVKTEPKAADEDELEKGLKEGQAIPYDRFKKVNEERKQLRQRVKDFEDGQGEDEELDAILKDPEVAALILKKQGFSDEAIAKKFQEAGIEVKKDGKEPTFDLTTVEGWKKQNEFMIEQALNKRLGPVEKTLSDVQTKEQMKVFQSRMETEATEAVKLSKEVYGIEYGNEDGKDPTTGAGKILNYLQKHPEKLGAASQGILSKSDLLRLAIAEEGVKLGEKKGEAKEKERHEKLKGAAMEGAETIVSDKPPTKDSTTDEILAYKNKYPNYRP